MKDGTMKGRTLALMYIGSFIAMFITMYAMVNSWSHVYININKAYMAGLMTASMGIVQVLVMSSMFSAKTRNMLIIGSVAMVTLLYIFIRQQFAVDEIRFLKSMIPHHSSAILMCEKATITDPEIKQLCDEIVKTQREEISVMVRMLRERGIGKP